MNEDRDIMLGEYREYMMQVQRISLEQSQLISAFTRRIMQVMTEDEMLSGDPADIAEVFFERTGKNLFRTSKTPYRRAIRFYQLFRGVIA